MQQSNIIFGMILVAFIVFITVRGELQTYLTFLRGGGASPSTDTQGSEPAAQTSAAGSIDIISEASAIAPDSRLSPQETYNDLVTLGYIQPGQ